MEPSKKDAENDDEDGFWQVAFMSSESVVVEPNLSDADDDDKDTKPSDGSVGKTTTYRFPTTSISLQLAELPANDGILSPVGADAWYASALLASMILQDDGYGIFGSALQDKEQPLRVLELGSGTKALPGFATAIGNETSGIVDG